MAQEKTVLIACEGIKTADIDDFSPLQGDLKTLADSDYAGLKAEIIEEGFSFSLHVWEEGEIKWIEDGHQRITALKRMRAEGWTVPAIPYSLVFADDIQQAKRKLLGGASSYGKVQEEGLRDFLSTMKIDPTRLMNFNFQTIEMPKFIATHLRFDEITQLGQMPPLSDAAQSEFQQRTFILTKPQAELIDSAIAAAKMRGDYAETGSENRNGNGLARVCQIFLDQNGGS
jgi:ParB family chromosome partitioning protein